jgi:hypothetical protein
MGLQADLTVKLDVSGPQGSFTADISGVLDTLAGIDLPLDPKAVEGIVSVAGSLDLSNLNVSAEALGKQILEVAGHLPIAGDLLGTITGIIEIAERFAEPSLETAITGLIDRLSAELDNLEGGPLGVFTRVAVLLKSAPEINLLQGLYGIFVQHGAPGLGAITLPEILPALAAAVRTLGALMNLEAQLAEAERTAVSASGRLDLAALLEREAVLQGQIDALVGIVASTDVGDLAAVEVTARAVAKAHLDLQAFLGDIAKAIALGDEAIAYLDFPRLLADVQALLGEIRAGDLSIIERAVADLAGKLVPILSLNLGGTPRFTLDTLMTEIETRAQALAGKIDAADLTPLTSLLETGFSEIARVPEEAAQRITDVKLTVASALQQVSDAVRAVPLDSVAAAIRSGANAVGKALEEVTGVLGAIDAALGTAVEALQSALDEAETAVGTFTNGVEAVFGDAAEFVDGLHLDQVAGQIADGINGFSATIAKADLAPYFTTATGAIDVAADVVVKVPFSLLPDSMEEEVVAVARPIKQTDLNQFRLEIQGVLQIGDDGTFTLRPDLEASVADIQAKMDALLAAVHEHDPKHLAAALEPALAELAAAISSAAPQINLAPIRQALDQAKAAVAGFDPAAALAPANLAFDDIIGRVDEFKPSALLQGVETRIDETREKLLSAARLRDWRARLDELQTQLIGFIALLDLTTLEDDIDRGLQELRRRIESNEQLRAFDAFGAIVAALLAGGPRGAPAHAFSAVADWLWGASAHAHLGGHAAAANGALVSMGATLDGLDPQAMAARLTPGLSRLNTAVAAKADGPGKARLEAALGVADPIAMLVVVGANRGRATARVNGALPPAGTLRDLSFAEADATATRLRAALAPFAVIPEVLNSIAGIVGLQGAIGQGLSGVILAVLNSAPPARLASMLTPVYVALRGRLEDLLKSVLDPLRAGIDNVIAVLEAIDIGDLHDELDAIHAGARGQIAAFKPATLLAEPLADFAAVQAAFAGFDPLGALEDAIKAAEKSVTRVLASLDPVKLVESPQAIFDDMIGALEQLDVGKLLEPIFVQLDAIAFQIDAGLENTCASFKRLQDALPDRIGSTSLSVSVSASASVN